MDVREVWPHEERDFTPWLANHADLLGAELGLQLELVAQEKPAGLANAATQDQELESSPVDGDGETT